MKKGRETIRNMMDSGEISFEHNKKGNRVIDLSELQRVFPEMNLLRESKEDAAKNATPENFDKLEKQYIQQLDQQQKEIERVHAMLDRQAEDYRQSLKLLEDRRGQAERQAEWEARLQEINSKITNASEIEAKAAELEKRHESEKRELQQKADAKLKELEQRFRQKLEAERSKTLFQRLFG